MSQSVCFLVARLVESLYDLDSVVELRRQASTDTSPLTIHNIRVLRQCLFDMKVALDNQDWLVVNQYAFWLRGKGRGMLLTCMRHTHGESTTPAEQAAAHALARDAFERMVATSTQIDVYRCQGSLARLPPFPTMLTQRKNEVSATEI